MFSKSLVLSNEHYESSGKNGSVRDSVVEGNLPLKKDNLAISRTPLLFDSILLYLSNERGQISFENFSS